MERVTAKPAATDTSTFVLEMFSWTCILQMQVSSQVTSEFMIATDYGPMK